MSEWRGRFRQPEIKCALWIALCFSLTSAVYLSWVYRMVAMARTTEADWFSLVLGYLCQAAGIALFCLARRTGRMKNPRHWFFGVLLLFAVFSVPSIMGDTFAGTVIFGLLMNLACGGITGFYLDAIARIDKPSRSSRIFGGAYAAGTILVGLLALPGSGNLMRRPEALLLYLPVCLILALAARWKTAEGDTQNASPPADLPAETMALACAAVILASLVKNIGFAFPSSDIADGLRPELSRIPYAIGLAAAGFIHDKNRRNGIFCTIAALAIPFIMLSMLSEPVPRTILWGLDYLFFSFFSVMRVVLFLDIAQRTRRWELAPAGLLLGRVGDAAGTAVSMLLDGHRLTMIAMTVLLFFAAVFFLFRLYHKLYAPQNTDKKSEEEIFETFCLRHDLSLRERDIFRMLIHGHTNTEIAEGLFISENTVKYHVRNVLQKTGCKNRVELQKKYTLALYPDLEDSAHASESSERS